MEITVSITIVLAIGFMVYHIAKREIEFWEKNSWNDVDKLPYLHEEFHDQFPVMVSDVVDIKIFDKKLNKEFIVDGLYENTTWTSNQMFLGPYIVVLGWKYKK